MFGGGKLMWWAILALVASTAGAGYMAKKYYDKSLLKDNEIAQILQAHQHTVTLLNEAVQFHSKRYDALAAAFRQQQEDYVAAMQETKQLRGKIRELKNRSPEVKEYLDTRVPDELYLRLFPDGGD
jgi:cytochrome b